MKIDITTDRDTDGLGRLMDQHNISIELKEDSTVLYREGFQRFYQGTLEDESAHDLFLRGLKHTHGLDLAIVVASDDGTHTIRSGTASLSGGLLTELERLEERFFIVSRNEWVSHEDFLQFYSQGNTDYKPGTPVERLRQAAYDTRRTGKAFLNLGLLKGWQPDVQAITSALRNQDNSAYENFCEWMNGMVSAVQKYESNDGVIKPKLTIEEADKAAKIFEQMASYVEPFWDEFEEDYNRGKRK
ncbi:hypothetical protein KY310_00195 [Candidatus Woesearchaeota archaeon]|nr:hypothetical protein [Candidatus Woesearchaeota archaeon]